MAYKGFEKASVRAKAFTVVEPTMLLLFSGIYDSSSAISLQILLL